MKTDLHPVSMVMKRTCNAHAMLEITHNRLFDSIMVTITENVSKICTNICTLKLVSMSEVFNVLVSR